MKDLELLRHVLDNATFALFQKESECAEVERRDSWARTDRVYYARAYHALHAVLALFYEPNSAMDAETELTDEEILGRAPWLDEFGKVVRATYRARAAYEKRIARDPTVPHPSGQWCDFVDLPVPPSAP